jgi:hypothetical protein
MHMAKITDLPGVGRCIRRHCHNAIHWGSRTTRDVNSWWTSFLSVQCNARFGGRTEPVLYLSQRILASQIRNLFRSEAGKQRLLDKYNTCASNAQLHCTCLQTMLDFAALSQTLQTAVRIEARTEGVSSMLRRLP